MLAIRVRRTGSTKRPYYRVVVTDSRAARHGRFVEVLGHYDPRRSPDLWSARHRMATADFSDRRDHFLNLNRPGELAQVERLLRRPGP